jgi:hypothetical protein
MDASLPSTTPVEFSRIADPDIRRAMRLMYEELTSTVRRQQLEIEVLLEMLIDNHMGSIGEFKRLLARLQSGGPRHGRVHDAVAGIAAPPAAPRDEIH